MPDKEHLSVIIVKKQDMNIIYNKIIPVKGFSAINLFGLVFARREYAPIDETTCRHESIHTAQQKEWLYIGFFILYFFEWIFKGYRKISFEVEAYDNQDDPCYLRTRRRYANYRKK